MESTLATQPKIWQDWLSGLRFILNSRIVSVIFLVIGIAGIAEGLFNVLFVIFIRQSLGGGAPEFGWLTSAQAVGGLVGSLVIGWLGHRILPNRLTGALAFNGLMILALVNLASFPLALALILLAGIPIVAYAVAVDTLLQRYVPDRYRGRVFGALATSAALFTLLGQAVASRLGDSIGAVSFLNVKGMLDIIAGLLAFILLYRINEPQPDLQGVSP